jgi:hypothetical protein
MTLNRDVFFEDPTKKPLPNDGVTKVLRPTTKKEWDVLRYELTSFVCDGEYERGLDRILSQYLAHLHEPTQPAAWVSGFYGSGKSHLVRVLEYVWRDVEFPDGSTARGLADLPASITDHLKELSTQGKRAGGLWSTAGTLGAGSGDSVRLAFLAVVFEGAGLARRYPQAQLQMRLRTEGFLEPVTAAVEAAGKDFDEELKSMYVSPVLAKAILENSPDFAADEKEVRANLRAQYPTVEDIGTDEVLDTLGDVLQMLSTEGGKYPCSLIVLDELQQFIHDDQSRLNHVQDIVEGCSTRFSSQVLVVGTGQNALGATAQMAKLQDRFTVAVELGDTDVERVVREIILRKKDDRKAEVKDTLTKVSGEIDRHLNGTKIGAEPADADDLVPDYPILPVRRRLWERVLRAIDKAGFTGQLRTQLRTTLEAVKEVAEEDLGTVVPADFVYGQQRGAMLKSGVLLREIEETIHNLDDGTEDGSLKARLCRMMFLISQLPTDAGVDTGIRATPGILADLLVSDLNAGSDGMRQRIPGLLEQLADAGTIMRVGEEYSLQTREGSDWESAYRQRFQAALSDSSKLVSDRDQALRAVVSEQLKGITLQQGESKTPRKAELHFGDQVPAAIGTSIPIWIRDEWSVTASTVQKEAAAAGQESPVVFVSLPKRDAEALKQALAKSSAAQETISTRPAPTTSEGQEALRSMESRAKSEKAKLDGLVRTIVDSARVFQAGGNDIAASTLRASVEEAAANALVRMFPQFDDADHKSWGTALRHAADGSGSLLKAVGYEGDPDKHPACSQVLDLIPGSGRKGQEVRKHFEDPPFGWPKDAVDAALLALTASDHLRAEQNATPVKARDITQSKLGVTTFYREDVIITVQQRIGVRKLLTDAHIPHQSGEEAAAIPVLLQAMVELAAAAGGAAPLPPPPDTTEVEGLQKMRGNEQFVAVWTAREVLLEKWNGWTRLKSEAESRLPRWRALDRLLAHAETLPEASKIKAQRDAIFEERNLLEEPDPLPPLIDQLTDALRAAVQRAHSELVEAHRKSEEELEASAEWKEIDEEQRGRIVAQQQLVEPSALEVGTPEQLLTTLDRTSLPDWIARIAALPERVVRARLEASRLLEPKSRKVVPPAATLKSREDVEAYMEELRNLILQHVEEGPVII